MSPSRQSFAALALTLGALIFVRAILLGADTPREVTSWSVGIFVDEGYKTLEARNQTLFGQSQWHPADDYTGWAARSPLTHWAYRAVFEVFGAELWAARATTIAWFAALLTAFAWSVRRSYSLGLTLLGLILLGTQHTLFFFSRSALFEVPLCLFLYGYLFALRNRFTLHNRFTLRDRRAAAGADRGAAAWFWLAVAVVSASFGVKASAPTYFVPVALGLLVNPLLERPRRGLVGLSALAVALAIAGWATHSIWHERIDLEVLEVPRRLWRGTFLHSTAPLAAFGLFAALHGMWAAPREFLADRYRACLVALTLLGPPLICLYSYRPLRYYVPFLPAYVLIALEWFHLELWKRPRPRAWQAGVQRAALAIGIALALLSSARDARVVGNFLRSPQWGVRDTAAALEAALPPGATVAGDWAPQLTLGTSLRSLYSNPRINHIGRFLELRPDYYIFASAAPWGFMGLDEPRPELEARGWLQLPPVVTGSYAGRNVLVYRMEYPER